jgi:hypothetical protein
MAKGQRWPDGDGMGGYRTNPAADSNLRGSTSTTPPTKWLLYFGLHFATDQLKKLRSDFEQFGCSIRIAALGSCRHALVGEPPEFVGIDYHGTPRNLSTRHSNVLIGRLRLSREAASDRHVPIPKRRQRARSLPRRSKSSAMRANRSASLLWTKVVISRCPELASSAYLLASSR